MSKVIATDWPVQPSNGYVCIQLQYMPSHLPQQRHVCLELGLLRTIRLISLLERTCVRAGMCWNAHAR